MKKKLLSAMLIAAMTASLFAGCGSSSSDSSDGTESGSSASSSSSDEATDTNITIWVANEVVDFTTQKVADFQEEYSEYADWTITVSEMGEGDAATSVITDVDSAADIFGFAQDQMNRLVAAGAVQQINDEYTTWITENNIEGAVAAAQVNDATYAFPMTADNGYFMYYDSSVITDPSSLEQILADCEAAGRTFYFEANSGWYNYAFFNAVGCESTYETDNDGAFTSCTSNYASDAGLVALKAMISLVESSAFVNGSSMSSADTSSIAAIVDGTWDSSAAKEAFGDNYACAKLPTFTGSDGETYQLGGFSGYKLLGIKQQTDATKLAACLALAQYLTNADTQLERFNEVGWGPSNVDAREDEAVASDEALIALGEQMTYMVPQGQYPEAWWNYGTAIGDDIIAGEISSSSSDDELMAVLETFDANCQSELN